MEIDPRERLARILGYSLAAEVVLPWCLIWLSDEYLFDITAGLEWAVFSGPAIVAVAALFGIALHSLPRRHPQVPHGGVR